MSASLRVLPGGAGLAATGVGKTYKKRPVVRNVSIALATTQVLSRRNCSSCAGINCLAVIGSPVLKYETGN